MTTNEESWERLLDPDRVRPSLFMATMFITNFEILKNSVVDRVGAYYSIDWGIEGAEVRPAYKAEVLSRNKSPLYASLDWLHEHEAINDEDLEAFERLKKIRNLLAHQLLEVVTGQVESRHEVEFHVLVKLLRKVEVWWVVNVEIPCNPDFDNEEIDEDGIVPSAILTTQMLWEVASGNSALLENWRKMRTLSASLKPRPEARN